MRELTHQDIERAIERANENKAITSQQLDVIKELYYITNDKVMVMNMLGEYVRNSLEHKYMKNF